MHLYDRLLHSQTHLTRTGREALRQSPLFLIDNVAAYVAEHYQGGLNPLTDTPILAPPFQRYFMEYRFPDTLWIRMKEARDFNPSRYSLTHLIESGANAIPDPQPLTRVGIWFEAELLTERLPHTEHTIAHYLFKTIIRYDLEQLGWEPTPDNTRRLANVACLSHDVAQHWSSDLIQGQTSYDDALHASQELLARLDEPTRAALLHRLTNEQIRAAIISNRLPAGLTNHLLPQRAKWKITARIFYEWMHHHRIHTQQMENFRYCISPSGQIPTDDQGQYCFYTFAPSLVGLQEAGGSTRGIDPYAGAATEELFIAFLATSFLHCKNVSVERHDSPSTPRHKKNRTPHITPSEYHILDIRPMKQILRSEGQIETQGMKQALHICRGHFKDFRERGLFGKHNGIYWWDQQVRGSAGIGTIHKDYQIHPSPTDRQRNTPAEHNTLQSGRPFVDTQSQAEVHKALRGEFDPS